MRHPLQLLRLRHLDAHHAMTLIVAEIAPDRSARKAAWRMIRREEGLDDDVRLERPGWICRPGRPLEDVVSTQSDHGTELLPRPERTPDAVRVALARIAPHRLDEMAKHKEEALAAAIRTAGSGTFSTG
ncbi:hypothetical protein [Streptomyces sp. NPDC012510]|uniref:hypothetical protein n=1 Tax=Streptomyces sp. NPDC012510 TaxID=3364838 RepID=UPI0036E5DE42